MGWGKGASALTQVPASCPGESGSQDLGPFALPGRFPQHLETSAPSPAIPPAPAFIRLLKINLKQVSAWLLTVCLKAGPGLASSLGPDLLSLLWEAWVSCNLFQNCSWSARRMPQKVVGALSSALPDGMGEVAVMEADSHRSCVPMITCNDLTHCSPPATLMQPRLGASVREGPWPARVPTAARPGPVQAPRSEAGG